MAVSENYFFTIARMSFSSSSSTLPKSCVIILFLEQFIRRRHLEGNVLPIRHRNTWFLGLFPFIHYHYFFLVFPLVFLSTYLIIIIHTNLLFRFWGNELCVVELFQTISQDRNAYAACTRSSSLALRTLNGSSMSQSVRIY